MLLSMRPVGHYDVISQASPYPHHPLPTLLKQHTYPIERLHHFESFPRYADHVSRKFPANPVGLRYMLGCVGVVADGSQ